MLGDAIVTNNHVAGIGPNSPWGSSGLCGDKNCAHSIRCFYFASDPDFHAENESPKQQERCNCLPNGE